MLTFVPALSYACISLQVAVFLPWSQRNFVNHLIFRIRSHRLTSVQMFQKNKGWNNKIKINMNIFICFLRVSYKLTGVNLFNGFSNWFCMHSVRNFYTFFCTNHSQREKNCFILCWLNVKCKTLAILEMVKWDFGKSLKGKLFHRLIKCIVMFFI